jgi:predicted exporter
MCKMRDRRLSLGVWLLAVLVCIVIIARTQFRTDMAAFLPHSASVAQEVLTEQATKGAASHLILVGIDGVPPATLAALSEAMAARLRGEPNFIDVINGDDKSFAQARDFVWRHRYLLSPGVTPSSFTTASLHQALLADLGLLSSDLGALMQQSMAADPTGELMRLLRQLEDGNGPQNQDGAWISADGRRALLLIHTTAPGFDIDAQQQAMALIGNAFERARSAVPNAKAAHLLESGPGVFAVSIRDTTERDVTRLSLLATTGAIGLLAFAYRSPLVILLGLLPVASGAVAGIAAVSLAFGFIHGVTIGFGVTLIGESLDYAIYLFSQTRRGSSANDTLGRIWPTLRLGALSSVVGFAAMLFSDFTGFAQLGLFSIAGLLAAAGVTRFVLPQLVPRGFFAAGVDGIGLPLHSVMRHRARLQWLVVGVTIAALGALAAHRGGFWSQSLAALSPIPPAEQAVDQTLRRDLGVPDLRFFTVFKAESEDQALEESEALAAILGRLAGQGRIGGFDVPSAILPSLSTQRTRRAALPDDATLRTRLAAANASLPFRANAFDPFLKDVAAARAAPLLTPSTLPPALALRLAAMLAPDGSGRIVIAPLHNVTDPASVASAIASAKLPELSLVDLNRESDQLLKRFQTEATLLASIGSVAILALLLLGLRRVSRVIAVAAPLAASVLTTAALLTFGGGKISIFMVVGFLLIVAVSSNYCLFFERPEQDEATQRRAVASVVLANLCTVSAYGLMVLSSIPVLHDIGKTVAIGTFLTLLFAAILSPHRARAATEAP